MSWGENFLRDFVGDFFGSDYLRDYTHASKTFRPNNYQYAPKLKFSFHTYFAINNQAYDLDRDEGTQQNFGLLVKEVKLPSYNFQTVQLNQYNRKRIVQTKIKYEPVQITFHDDNSNQMARLWAAYYTYYYGDASTPDVVFSGNRGSQGSDSTSVVTLAGVGLGTYPQPTDANYNTRNIYDPQLINQNWGYIGDSNAAADPANGGTKKIPFFKNITIFGINNQKNFLAYTLINPIITNFSHDTYNYNEGGGIMQNTMILDYETVVYNEGALDGNNPGSIVAGFGDEATYDRTLSPIAKPGSNSTILGKGGMIDSVGGAIKGLGNNGLKGVIQSVQTIGTAYNTFRNTDLKQQLQAEFNSMLSDALSSNPNESRNLQFNFPSPASTPGVAGTAGSPTIDAQQQPEQLEEVSITATRTTPLDEISITATRTTPLDEIVITAKPVGKQISTKTSDLDPPPVGEGFSTGI